MSTFRTAEWIFSISSEDKMEMEERNEVFSSAIIKNNIVVKHPTKSTSSMLSASPHSMYSRSASAKSKMVKRDIKEKLSMYNGSETKSEIAADVAITKKHEQSLSCIDAVMVFLSVIIVFLTFPFSICYITKVVREHERVVKFRMGKVVHGKALGPGIVLVLPCVDRHVKVDLRTVLFDVPPQEILTKDSVSIAVDAVAYFKVFDPMLSVLAIGDAYYGTRMLAATTLRNILGTKTLEEILSDRDEISSIMQMILDEATDPWGVHVERVEVKDVRLPVQLQRAMAAEAEAAREASAKIIAARGEMDASDALKNAADKLNEAPSAIQLRYLQTLNTISSEKNSTIVFPLPLGIIKALTEKK